jgi:hypothetical protein
MYLRNVGIDVRNYTEPKPKTTPTSNVCIYGIYYKAKSYSATRHGGAWVERRYSSYSFSTFALDGMSGQRHAPAALYSRGKDPRYPLYRRLSGPQSRSGHRGCRKNLLSLLGIEPRSPGRPTRSQGFYYRFHLISSDKVH